MTRAERMCSDTDCPMQDFPHPPHEDHRTRAGYTVDDSPETIARNRHDSGSCGPACVRCEAERWERMDG